MKNATKAAHASKALRALASKEKAAVQMSFFKTGKGQYGEGDKFLGATVPEIRKLLPRFESMEKAELSVLLDSPWNEERLLALLIMVRSYAGGDAAEKASIYRFYLEKMERVNNWNLVDASAHYIVGDYLLKKDKGPLYKFSKSKNLWVRRIAVVATWAMIRQGCYEDTLKLSSIYLQDKEDLMHKACGWMLREVGKKDEAVLVNFLEENHTVMPRTMLRYAIEKFPEKRRKDFLKGKFS